MTFNELNSVEYFIINQLSGVNLLDKTIQEPQTEYGQQWKYIPSEQLQREITEVLLETELRDALIRLNPAIASNPDRADEVIHKLRAILISVSHSGLVCANEEFTKWMLGDKTMPFGENNRHVSIKLIDFEDISQNSFVVTNQYRVRARETKIPDLVFFINGLPIVLGEVKTPVRPSVSWLDGAHEVHKIYENAIPQLFVPSIFSFATEGKELFYGSVRCPLQQWSPWRIEEEENILPIKSLTEVGKQLSHLMHLKILLDILQNFALFATDKKKRRIKIVCRYQQYEGANKIIQRVLAGQIKKGLIWHFQGSGKSLLMVFAAQKLRKMQQLKSPTVIIVIDRVDLDSQITGTFHASDVPNMVSVNSISELNDLLEKDTRKILITTIHKFKDAYPDINTRENIILMVDEAHRTQEGDLDRKMRSALPNAFLFGLTGTPINKADKNTFWAFGSEEDQGGYLSKYSFQDSIRDNATLPLHFERMCMWIKKPSINFLKS